MQSVLQHHRSRQVDQGRPGTCRESTIATVTVQVVSSKEDRWYIS